MPVIPMFPLGSVLFPAMPLALQVFEERYLKMMGAILDAEEPVFGVVLIERGSEVGGGDQRFDLGTTARVLQIEAPEGPLQVVAKGDRRFRVLSWLDEDPYPQAEVEFLEEFPGDEVEPSALESAEKVVRDTLAYLLELDLSIPWPTDIELAEDPVEKAWQLAGIAPLGTLDHQDLLESADVSTLLTEVEQTVAAALEVFKMTRDSGE
jgi:Lon protease-like protein